MFPRTTLPPSSGHFYYQDGKLTIFQITNYTKTLIKKLFSIS
jgi:hypothetical protein